MKGEHGIFPMIGEPTEQIIEHGAKGIAEGFKLIPPKLLGYIGIIFAAKLAFDYFRGKSKQA
jgi:hypothetical protein